MYKFTYSQRYVCFVFISFSFCTISILILSIKIILVLEITMLPDFRARNGRFRQSCLCDLFIQDYRRRSETVTPAFRRPDSQPSVRERSGVGDDSRLRATRAAALGRGITGAIVPEFEFFERWKTCCTLILKNSRK